MSEEILKALVQLFSLIAFPEKENEIRREIVRNFLTNQLNDRTADDYFKLYENYYEQHVLKLERLQKRDFSKPALTANSVKALRIARATNKELTHFQKLIVIIRLIEFLKSGIEISNYERDFVSTIAESFNINKEEFQLMESFVISDFNDPIDSPNLLIINNQKYAQSNNIKCFYAPSIRDEIQVVNVISGGMFLLRVKGESEISINGQIVNSERIHVLTPGSSIRNRKLDPIYYSDIVSKFNSDNIQSSIQLEVDQISYYYDDKKNGVQPMSFTSEAGKMVGIMGASGAGKSTLINILSGIIKPQKGTVCINGIDIHQDNDSINGLIGYVSQDDLLMEKLTVYQNLYYNAKLCFDGYNEFYIKKKVLSLLKSLGLFETKDMIVGSPLNKKISGGQRKRLNIALELIREPSILFLDEPTSGLSSRDSENILDLLKELTLKGKLVFVVIHQPSSDIFKMFNQLLVVDTGGYLIYDGDPVEGINYFKSNINLANKLESECNTCGNVNPEQILNIVSANIIDEYGHFTQKRKREPRDWYKLFKNEKPNTPLNEYGELPPISFKVPNKIKQFFVFVKRDVLSKISNKQYLLINLLETPILALLLATIIKFYNVDAGTSNKYIYQNNPNIIVYIVMAVIIAIFVGLTVSAEEIISDRKILKREKFLNLSRLSYLFSKLFILSVISAIQTLLFVIIGNSIVEIKGEFFEYWAVLFSASIFANILGLNISDSFKQAVNIYITIPFLIIPQIILSGVFISYDNLNPKFSNPDQIPWYGEIITARWAFEALTVNQFRNNKYEKDFFVYDKIKSQAQFKKEFWIPALQSKLTSAHKAYTFSKNDSTLKASLGLLKNEISKEKVSPNIDISFIDKLNTNDFNDEIFEATIVYLDFKKAYYKRLFNRTDEALDLKKKALIKETSTSNLVALRQDYTNTEIDRFVTNSNNIFTNKIIEYNDHLIQKVDPIYKEPQSKFIQAHFLSPFKRIGNIKLDTLWVNIIVIWFFNLVLFVTLYFGLSNRIFSFLKRILNRNKY